MEVFLWVAVTVLFTAVVILSIKLCLMKKSAAEIASAFSDILTEDTNILIDITCRDRHMRALANEINKELAALRDERHRFVQGDSELKEAVTNISRDLRTPLTAVCGYLDLLDSEEKSETVSKYIDMIKNRTEALIALTEELFRYSVIVSVNDDTSEKLSLNSALEETLVSFYGAMKQHNITPEIDITETVVWRTLNRSALSRVFGNIISNALKYGENDLYVTLNDDGVITFANTASKLTKVEVGKLFDRFFTVETGRGSTGLGLSIAKLLTERMGGEIFAQYEDIKLKIILKL